MDRKKKTVLMVTLVCVAMAAVAAGIILLSIYMEKRGGQKATESRQNAVTSTAVKAEEDALKDGAVADFVGTGDLKLGDYKGIEVDTEPTEDEVLEAMESQLLKMTKDHKGRIQEGDYVCVDYKGYIDGQQYEELSEEDAVLRVGDFAQEEAFEKSLIGKQPGDKVSASVVYDDSYEELSGETVDFKITIKGRFDDYYADKFSKGKNPTVRQYVADVRETLKKQNGTPEYAGEMAWGTVLESCEVIRYPKGAVEEEEKELKEQYEAFAQMHGVSYEELLQGFGMSEESLPELAQETVMERMAVKTIIAREQLVFDDAAYEKYLLSSMEYSENSGKKLEELEREYREDYGSHPKDDMMLLFVQEYVGSNAKLV